ncbi:MAG: hypothetical protein K6A38_07605 [Lachnospiraceae bacterium]|nr:hypothetical protein [Lachnospiraceae bacterium]
MSMINNEKLQKLDDAALDQVNGGMIMLNDKLLDSRVDEMNVDKKKAGMLNADQNDAAKTVKNRPVIMQG